MAVKQEKQEKEVIGFDPLAWMDEESTETEIAESEKTKAPEQEIKAEHVEEEKPVVEKEINIDASLKEPALSEEEKPVGEEMPVASEPSIEQTTDSTDKSKITLDAILNIQGVSALYEQLHVLLEEQERIEIDASSVSTIDTAALQLLVVLKQTAIKLHKEVIIDFPSDKFIEAAELLGLSEMLEVDQAAAGLF
jgi:ABC-type transporter Mla MlaB component